MEGKHMDPDQDPNLQHRLGRVDNVQWVAGSVVSLLDGIPT
ncbi:hypothetical protein [Mycolicibacterium xanthum]|nr:hypothetical protein [Mycolicibacterium xanthum]